MNIVSIEHILVFICTMIGMNYAGKIEDCVHQVNSMFIEQHKSNEERIKFIIRSMTLNDIKKNPNQKMYVEHLFNAISENTPKNTLNAKEFCEQYDAEEACFNELISKKIEKAATAEFIVEEVYFYLKQGNTGYIFDLIDHVYKSIVITESDLFGMEDTKDFCRMKSCSDSIRAVFPVGCTNFTKPGYYIYYTNLMVAVNDLEDDFSKEFLVHLFTVVSKLEHNNLDEIMEEETANPKFISPDGFCDFFESALSGEIKTDLAKSTKNYFDNEHTDYNSFDRKSCKKDIARLKLPIHSFYETAKTIYFEFSMNKAYSPEELNDRNIIKYAVHYFRLINRLTIALPMIDGKKAVITPEQYCANNLKRYEDGANFIKN